MIGTSFMDEIDCGNFFDNMDDLLEFPANDDGGIVGSSGKLRATIGDYCGAFSNSIWDDPAADNNSPDNTLAGVSDSVFSGSTNTNASATDLSAELSLPYEDILQLEWLSTFVEDSFSADGMTMKNDTRTSSPSHNQFQTSSPVSVLESSGSCNNANAGANAPGTLPVCHEKRARSKRPRPTAFTPKPYMHHLMVSSPDHSPRPPLFVPNSLYGPFKRAKKVKKLASSSSSSSSSSSGAVDAHPKKKTTKIRILPPCPNAEKPLRNQDQNEDPNPASLQQQGPVRKCLHCQITKTPQWRAGPMGPKTLCNACGVRYKSGRLFPEYRPAASPTFVPALHSNSHKKVLEMRSKGTEEAGSGKPDGDKSIVTYLQAEAAPAAACVLAAEPGSTSSQAELIPKSNLLPDYI